MVSEATTTWRRVESTYEEDEVQDTGLEQDVHDSLALCLLVRYAQMTTDVPSVLPKSNRLRVTIASREELRTMSCTRS